MTRKRTAMILCLVLFWAAGALAEAQDDREDAAFPDFGALLRNGGALAPAAELTNAGTEPMTTDDVTVRADGSFRICTGELTFSSAQPAGFTYFTQSREAQRELYAELERQTGRRASSFIYALTQANTHIYYLNYWYKIEMMVSADGRVRAGLPDDFGAEGAEEAIRKAFDREFGRVEVRTIGKHRYAVVYDRVESRQPEVVYYTAVGGKLIRIDCEYENYSAEAEAVMEEALALLQIRDGDVRTAAGAREPDVSAYGEVAPKRKLTVMVYLPGADLESRPVYGGNATNALSTMLSSGFSREEVNAVIFTGGALRWYSAAIPADVNTIRVVREGRETAEVYRSDRQLNMGTAETLAFFLNYCVEHYPAERYGLILCDHGCGPVYGLCVDETSRNIWIGGEMIGSDRIMLDELRAGLEASPFGGDRRIDFLYFGTCLAASVETAMVCAPYADWMVCSEEPGFTLAYPYELPEGIESMSGEAVCRQIAETFFTRAGRIDSRNRNTMSVLDLRQMDELAEKLDALFAAVLEGLGADTFKRSAKASLRAERIDPYPADYEEYDNDLIDLRGLLDGYTVWFPEECAAAASALDRVVVYSRSVVPAETGLSIFHPNYNVSRRAFNGSLYRNLPFCENYIGYVDRYIELAAGRNGANASPRSGAERPDSREFSAITVPMDAEALDDLRDAELLILEDTGTADVYRLIGRQIVPVPAEGGLEIGVSHEALYAVDADGRPLTDALEYSVIGDEILIRAVLEVDLSHRALTLGDVNALDLDEDTVFSQNVILRCVRGEDGTLLIHRVQNALGGGMADGRTVNPEDFDWLYLVSTPRLAARDEDGEPLPWYSWTDGGIHNYRYAIDLSREWSLAFRDDHLTWVGRSAMLVATDLWGVTRVLSWTELENPANRALGVEPHLLCEDEDCAVSLEAAWLNTGSEVPALFVRWGLTNRSDAPVTFTADEFSLDGAALDKAAELLGTVQPGATAYAVSRIDAPDEAGFAPGAVLSVTFDSIAEVGFGLWTTVEIELP